MSSVPAQMQGKAPGLGVSVPPDAAADRGRQQGKYLFDNILWMVRLRWIAVLGIGIALAVASAVGWSDSILWPSIIATALAGSNLTVWLVYRTPPEHFDPSRLQRQIVGQLHVDLIALALLVHWTGGISNPFVMFFIFPVSTGAILLRTRAAALIGATAFVLFAGLLLCDIMSVHPSRPLGSPGDHLGGLLEHPVFVVGLLVAAAMTLLGIVYFIRTVVTQNEIAEERRRHHERIALSRERMARVGMIAAGVAHSVRNPLHGVLNCIDLVRDSRSPEEAAETLTLMQEGLSRIEKVTSRLLSLSRESPLGPKLVDLDELVEDTLRLLEVRFQKQGVAMRTELGGLREVRIDPVRIQEALFNILDNAMAAVADARERWVLVRTNRIEQPFVGFSLEVVDPGIGVDEAALGHVFDPFFSTKPVGEGTGLGLAIAKEVVEAHGGVIQFLSKRNAGTNVRILIPSDAPASLDGGGA